MYKQREKETNEDFSDSDGISIVPDSTSDDLCDLDIDDNFLMPNYSQESFKFPESKAEKMKKLQAVKLDPISISSASARPQPIVNLQQSFNFKAPLKSSKIISTQTSKMDLIRNSSTLAEEKMEEKRIVRPLSLPPENAALYEKRVQADVNPKFVEQMIGDGGKSIHPYPQNDLVKTECRQTDLELADYIPPVQSVVAKPK